ncbi:MAG: Holliday junction branch migration DNA helicase RuvB [Holosporaceae bacterium]|jgi:Holliday junction DNA helicase RuvB|nr:Holliday junction branch migration DNA helicase RuvB [Holosporaceae bacterium]
MNDRGCKSEAKTTMNPQQQTMDYGEYSLRPNSLENFIGQESVKSNLQVFIKSAKQRKIAMDHVLFFGPPGLGKTTLSQIISKELDVGFKSTSGPILAKAGDLAAILTNLKELDVLFIDEIHRINHLVEEILYPAMEDFQLDLMIGDGPAARSIRIDLPHFTLIGATTRSGMLSSPLRDRFGIPLRLEFYNPYELQIIIAKNAQLLGIDICNNGAEEIAKRSRGTPRIACRLLKRVRDFAVVTGAVLIDKNMADVALKKLDVDEYGLDAMDRKYLRSILEFYNGGPVGVDTLAAALAEKRDTLEEVIEPFILQIGLLQRTARGRMLTSEGYKYLGATTPPAADDDCDVPNGS